MFILVTQEVLHNFFLCVYICLTKKFVIMNLLRDGVPMIYMVFMWPIFMFYYFIADTVKSKINRQFITSLTIYDIYERSRICGLLYLPFFVFCKFVSN